MKKLLYFLAITIILASCGNNTQQDADNAQKPLPKKEIPGNNLKSYGDNVELKGAADATRLPSMLEGINEKEIKVIGKVVDVCQSSGCWLDIDLGNNTVMHVTFKDEAFVVPKDITGKVILMDGVASKEMLSVDMLKKMAADEGKTQSEIDKITEPGIEYSYEAKGVSIN